jgi:glyoxylase I family protein
MQLSAIHHIAIIVSDYEVSRDFYVNKLGFQVIRENWRPEKQDWKLDLRINESTELEVFAPQNPPKRPSYPEACGLRHLAFHTADIEQTVEELNAFGIDCEPIRTDTFTGRKMTFFFDPDGLPLELHE